MEGKLKAAIRLAAPATANISKYWNSFMFQCTTTLHPKAEERTDTTHRDDALKKPSANQLAKQPCAVFRVCAEVGLPSKSTLPYDDDKKYNPLDENLKTDLIQ